MPVFKSLSLQKALTKAPLEILQEYKNAADWVITRPILTRRDCVIYRAESKSLGITAAIKLYNSKKIEQNAPLLLFNAMKSYYANAAKTPGIGVPEPLYVDSNNSAVIMEWIDAPHVKQALRLRGLSRTERTAIISKCGVWLRWFHDQSKIKPEIYDATRHLKKIENTLPKLQSLGCHILANDKIFNECLRVFYKCMESLGSFEVEHCITHSDYTPLNVFIDGDKIIGFDFLANKRAPITNDICRFLSYLGIFQHRFISTHDLQTLGCNRDDYDAFVSTYGDTMKNIPQNIFLYLQYSEIMRRWVALTEQNFTAGRRIHRNIQIMRLKRMAKFIAKGLKQTILENEPGIGSIAA